MTSKYDDYALESLLHDIHEQGYVFVNKYKMWRLLGKGSGAAGTWKAMLDSWEELSENNKRSGLYGFEIGNDYFFTTIKTTSLEGWAGEK